MEGLALLAAARAAGLAVCVEGEGLVIQGPESAEAVVMELLERKAEIIDLLTIPHINGRGELIIPHDAAPQYRWWNGGQSIRATLIELGASPDVVARYVEKGRR